MLSESMPRPGELGMLVALLIPIGLAVIVYAAMLLRAAIAARAVPKIEGAILGAITNFFDTLGIGSFAPTMAWLKVRKLVPDRLIPCTMLVGHTLPTLAQAIIGTTLDDAAMEKLDAACRKACRPIDDKRGTVEFRTKVAGVLARRAAKIAYARAGGK